LLTCAIIKCESNWNEAAVSDAGAVGLMQMMPATSAELAEWGVVDVWSYDPSNLTDPTTNIEYGCAYLGQLQLRLGSLDEVVAAYNAGPGSVEQWLSGGGDIADVIDFPETALYLKRVNETYERYQQLYTETLDPR
jgi:soluble lytic murein transglycosylase